MRRDPDSGAEVPGTLGEYRELCVLIGGQRSPAVKFLDTVIARSPNGADAVVLASDIQMRAVLMPMLLEDEPS